MNAYALLFAIGCDLLQKNIFNIQQTIIFQNIVFISFICFYYISVSKLLQALFRNYLFIF